jgi:hypothetical protein
MGHLKASPIVIAAALVALLACNARAAETAEQRGRRVVDEAIAALGGDALLHMQDRTETGRVYSFYDSKMSGASPIAKIYTRYLTPAGTPVPGKLYVEERESFGAEERYGAILFTPVPEAWEITFRGARPFADDQLAKYKDTTLHNFFYVVRQRLKEPDVSFYFTGTDFIDSRPVNIVQVTCADNVPVTVSFDQLTKLPVRQMYKRRNEEYHDMDTEVTAFARYRDDSGVKWPHDIRRDRNGEKIYEMFSDSVEINKGLRDELFRLSGAVKTLPKGK